MVSPILQNVDFGFCRACQVDPLLYTDIKSEETCPHIIKARRQQIILEMDYRKHEFYQQKVRHNQSILYARKLFSLIRILLIIILLVMVASGSNYKNFSLEISDSVLIALCTATIGILGLFTSLFKDVLGGR